MWYMKKVKAVLMVVLFAVSAHAQFTKARLQATGLTCAMCSNAINKSLQKVSFVESVKPDIKNSAFDITFKPGTDIDIDKIREAVEDAGFSIGKLQLTGNFSGLKIFHDEHVKLGKENFHFLGDDDKVLNGENTLQVLDKDFVPAKEYKKFSAATKMPCMKNGKAAACCVKEGMTEGERVYHVKI
jgi:copper chaperone CopZ